MSPLLKRLFNHISSRRQCQMMFLFALMLVSALAEIVSLGSILPFIGVLNDPAGVLQNSNEVVLAKYIGADSAEELALPLTLLFVGSVLTSGIVRLLVLLISSRLSFAIGVDLSICMYRRSLYQPYRVHVDRNSSEVISGIAQKSSSVIVGVLIPLLLFLSSNFIFIALKAMRGEVLCE